MVLLHILKSFRKIQLDLFTKSFRLQKYPYYRSKWFEEFKQVLEIKEVLYQLIGMELEQKRR
jgi:hypothetical protein